MIIPVYGVSERKAVIGYANHVMSSEVEVETLKALRETTLRYQISFSVHH